METKLDLSVLEPRVLEAVLDVARSVRDAGGRALMVGGSVRDLMLGGADVKDVDLEVFGVPPETLQRVVGARHPFDPCGVSFGVLKLQHLDVDVSLPRRESKCGAGHKGFLVDSDPNLSVAEAASRRDFTVNAMYYDPLAGRFEDPHGGAEDLERRVLRHVSPKFSEDPLRVLRGMQFVARFGLEPAPETVAICRTIGMEGLPPERLFEEWAKLLLKGREIGRGLEFLRATRWLRHFPELARLVGCRQDPEWHPEGDAWEHVKLCLDAFARHRTGVRDEDLIVGLAVVCHDFGKPATTRFDPVKKRIRSLGHDEAGVAPTLSFLRRLTNEERILREVPPLVRCHMQPFALWKSKAGDAAIRRLAMKVGRIDRLLRVAHADDEGRTVERRGGSSGGEDLAWLAAQAERLRVAGEAPKPILMGRHLMARGHKPSRRFGEWLDACFEAQLDGAFHDLDGAIAYFAGHFERPTDGARP
ncbi:MAG: polynucleotide adenylyltransferase [Kiritimatiellae bacterium]|nr:polynucleotide adenylyltransferase [Kiritimatiellia bacterium]